MTKQLSMAKSIENHTEGQKLLIGLAVVMVGVLIVKVIACIMHGAKKKWLTIN